MQQRTDGRRGQWQHTDDHTGVYRFNMPHGNRREQWKAEHHTRRRNCQRPPVLSFGPGCACGKQKNCRQGGGHDSPADGNEHARHLRRISRAHGQACHWQRERKDGDAQQAQEQPAVELALVVRGFHNISIQRAVSTSTAAMMRLKTRSRRPVPAGPASQWRSSEPASA